MAHFVRERPDEGYYLGGTIPGSLLRNIDEKLKKAITESGGTWTPVAPVIIQGAGIEIQTKMVLSGGAVAKPSAFIFGDNDYFRMSSGQLRSIRQSPHEFLPTPDTASQVRLVGAVAAAAALLIRRPGALVRLPLRLPDATFLTEVVVSYSIPFGHTNLPAHLPAARVVSIDRDGVIAPLEFDLTGDGRDKWKTLDPADVAAYEASHALQTLTLSFGGEPIKRSQYDYAVEWRDEYGAGTYPERSENGTAITALKSTVTYSELAPF